MTRIDSKYRYFALTYPLGGTKECAVATDADNALRISRQLINNMHALTK